MKSKLLTRLCNFITVGIIYSSILCPVSTAQTISTVAGQGGAGYNGDGMAATAAQLFTPKSVLRDAGGNVYIGDQVNGRIRKVNSTGIITTFAGNGNTFNTGDGGQATAAGFAGIYSLTMDAAGNLYVGCDMSVRKISTSGIVTTIAGAMTGAYGFSGDGGQATAARITDVAGIVIDGAGSIIFCDKGNNRIRKVNTSGIITTIAGNGTAGFSGDGAAATAAKLNGPNGIAINSSNEIVFGDGANNRIRKISTSGIISTIAGSSTTGWFGGDGGPATAALFSGVGGIAIDGSNNIYVAEYYNERIRKISASGIISTVAGTGSIGYNGDGISATSVTLTHPQNVYADASGVYFTEEQSDRVRKISTSGIISTVAGMGHPGFRGDGGSAVNGELFKPQGIAVDRSGNLFIADVYNDRVRKVTPAGIITTFAGNGAHSSGGNGGQATAAQTMFPSSVAVDASGNVFITESDLIRKINSSGVISTYAGGGSSLADGIAATAASLAHCGNIFIDASGNIYVPDGVNNVVRKINTSGIITTFAGNWAAGFSGDGGAATAAALSFPTHVTFDGAGNVYICDANNRCIRKVTPSGMISTVAGDGSYSVSGDGGAASAAGLLGMSAMACDSAGNLYITHSGDNIIRKINTSGIIHTICGSASKGYSGNGGPASAALVNSPSSLFVTPSGVLYFTDDENNVIRKILNCNLPTVGAITGATSVYTGAAITLTDATAGGTWRSGSPSIASVDASGNITGIASGIAPISYTLTNSCGSTSAIGNITVAPHPIPSFLSSLYTVGFCSSTGSYPLNTLLRANYPTAGQTITWSLATAPAHGTAYVAYSTTSTGSLIVPTGLTYTPTAGYSGIDTFRVQVSDGVASSNITIVITTLAGPAIATISGPTSVCVGATITLSASVAGGTWSMATSLATISSGGVVTGLVGTYTNTAYYTTTSAYCGTSIASHGITINAVPVPYPIAGPSSVAVGGSITLSNAIAGGTWSSSAPGLASVNASSGLVTGAGAGTATITYSVTNACGTGINTRSITVSAHRDANGEENTLTGSPSIRVFPNPNQGYFTLELPEGTLSATITISDLSGKVIANVITTNTKEDFNISNRPKGMYLMNVDANGSKIVQRIIVQ